MEENQGFNLISKYAPLLALLFAGHQFWSFYSGYRTDPSSEYFVRTQQLEQSKRELKDLEKKNEEMVEFVKKLEAAKAELAAQSQQLIELKAAMAERVDVADFTRLVVTEAKRAGLTVLAIKPKARLEQEYYREFPFELKFRGVYPQILTFLSRVANLQRLIRVDSFGLKPVSDTGAQFVQLEGQFEVKTFAYLGSQADGIGQKPEGSK